MWIYAHTAWRTAAFLFSMVPFVVIILLICDYIRAGKTHPITNPALIPITFSLLGLFFQYILVNDTELSFIVSHTVALLSIEAYSLEDSGMKRIPSITFGEEASVKQRFLNMFDVIIASLKYGVFAALASTLVFYLFFV